MLDSYNRRHEVPPPNAGCSDCRCTAAAVGNLPLAQAARAAAFGSKLPLVAAGLRALCDSQALRIFRKTTLMRFTLRDLFWLTVVVALVLGWGVSYANLFDRLRARGRHAEALRH